MDDRTKTLLSFVLLAAALITSGCGYPQQSKFQMSFLPPAAHSATASELIPAPAVTPNPYLQQMPAILLTNPVAPKRRTAGDAKVQQAEAAFQRGRSAYQRNDFSGARREFDAAIDLMLEASDETPADRQEYEGRLDQMVDAIHRFDLTGLGAAAIEEGKFEKAPLEDILQMTFPVDPRLKDRVREQVSATVSQLPLSVNDTVLGYINYFSNRGHKTLVAGTQRSGRYRPMIQRILDEEGVPKELIHLAQAESGFIPRAVSRKAAGGMWQFLTWRGQQYGLMQTRYTDDRMDPEKATRAAARHLRDLYTEFGDWYLAIAAYNCGPGAVERAVERSGYADFWELRSRGLLPAETTNYVPIILAMTIMEKNASEYGLEGIQFDPALEYDTIEISAPTSLNLVSDITGVPQSELASLNPSLLKAVAPENYSLRVPKGSGNQLMAALQLIPGEHRDSWRLHTVGPGETLSIVAKRYGMSPTSIANASNLKAAELTEGDRILIPSQARIEAAPRSAGARTATQRSAKSSSRRSVKRTASAPKPAVKSVRRAPVTVARASR